MNHEETKRESQSSVLFPKKDLSSWKPKLKVKNSKYYKKNTNFTGNTEEEEIDLGSC